MAHIPVLLLAILSSAVSADSYNDGEVIVLNDGRGEKYTPFTKFILSLNVSNYYHGKFNGRLSLLQQVRDETLSSLKNVDSTAKFEYDVLNVNLTDLQMEFRILQNNANTSVKQYQQNYQRYRQTLTGIRRLATYSIKDMEIYNNALDSCAQETIGKIKFKGAYTYPDTLIGRTVYKKCSYGGGNFSRSCIPNLNGAAWSKAEFGHCKAKFITTRTLIEIRKSFEGCIAVNPPPHCESALNKSIALDDSIEKPSNITVQEDITLISDILGNITNLIETVNQTKESLKEIVNKTVSVIDKITETADTIQIDDEEESRRSSQLMLKSFQTVVKLGSKSLSDDEELIVESQNIAVLALNPPPGSQDLEFTSSLNKRNGKINIKETTQGRHLSSNPFFYGSVKIPSTIFTDSPECQKNLYTYVIRKSTFLFPGETAKSPVIAVACGNKEIENLTRPVELTLTLQDNSSIPMTVCVSWDEEKGNWSQRGVSKSQTNSSDLTSCLTNHLTNFAIILDVSQTQSNPLALQIITWIGCGISLGGLFLTIVSFSIFERVRRKLVPKLLICLSTSLGLTLIIFLTLVEMTTPRILCQIVAGLIQYFVLCTFCWSAVEGFHLYYSFVKVFSGGSNGKFFRRAFLFATGLPAVVVIVTASLCPENYGNDKFCMINGLPFFLSMFLPICVILLGNLFVLFLVLRNIKKAEKKARKSQDTSNTMRNLKIAFACSVLLGLTWIFGVFAVGELTTVFQYLFCIFNSSQGLFIFLFYTFSNADLKTEWLILLRIKKRNQPVTSNLQMQSKTTTY